MTKEPNSLRSNQPVTIDGGRNDSPKIRKSVLMAQQTLGDFKRGAQLGLLDTAKDIDWSGINLEPMEIYALESIHIALFETGYDEELKMYRGDAQTISTDTDTGESITAPYVRISELELMQLMNIERGGNGRYAKKKKDSARNALEGLANKRHTITYERKTTTGKGQKREVTVTEVKIRKSLINLEEISFREYIENKPGRADKRMKYYKITVHPILFEQLDSFYYLQPRSLMADIDEAKKIVGRNRGRPTSHEWYLITYLLTLNYKAINHKDEKGEFHKIGETLLAQKLNTTHLNKSRHRGRTETAIEQAVTIAEMRDYLHEGSFHADGFWYLKINKEHLRRQKKKIES
jgi:hypothetical protein